MSEQIAKLSKNSSNYSKPPSSDIVKPFKDQKSKKLRRQGGQLVIDRRITQGSRSLMGRQWNARNWPK